MKEQKPEDVVAMAAEYNIHFLRRRGVKYRDVILRCEPRRM